MLDRWNQIDWGKLGNPKIQNYLWEALSVDAITRGEALSKLKNAIAPWELLDGYGSTENLMKIAESPIAEAVIPFLIELLKDENYGDSGRSYLMEILYDLSRYEFVTKDFIPRDKEESYLAWARRIRHLVRSEINFYRTFLNSDWIEVQQSAEDLIRVLTSNKDDYLTQENAT